MKSTRPLFTDTATIVLFDPARLAGRQHDECDWWTGDADLEREEAAENLSFVGTRTDGTYEVVVSVDDIVLDGTVLKRSMLRVESSELVFGPGERLPGEGVLRDPRLAGISISPGVYEVTVSVTYAKDPNVPTGYCFALQRR